ncbi:MAG TPA: glycosyltransferase family 39 protein [Bryobacteraceae bacterium]|nr:glycosyltransferase family 39 protein [Bryobacteraceae bacterium]
MGPRYRYLPWFIGSLLLALQFCFLAAPGIEEDEALFVAPFLRGASSLYEWRWGAFHIPVMSMDYLGALKSWLYWPVFRVWHPGVWSMRLPACVLSVVTLLLFVDVARRAAGRRVALAAAVILATDAVFVLINVFDMTVCLLLLATVAFLWLLQRGRLGAAFFVAGLALWYKAIFLFPLCAMPLGFAIAYTSHVRRCLTWRNIAVAVVGIVVGCAPLIAFNLARRGATFQASRDLPGVAAGEKLVMLQHTLDGRAFEHYMFRSTRDEKIALAGSSMADVVVGWYRESHFGPGSALLPVLLLSLLALPFLRRSALFPALVFSWVAGGAAYAAMLFFRDAGAGPHHTVLLDPAPQFIVAASVAALAERWKVSRSAALLVLCVVVAGSNLWLLSRYWQAARANGFSVYWTDGVKNLANVLRAQSLPVASLEWGTHNGPQIEAGDTLNFVADTSPRENVLYVTHCEGYVIDPRRAALFEQDAAAAGLHQTANRVVADRKGHLVYCLFQLAKD